VNGLPITPNPNTFPDITINTTAPVPVVIQTHNIPTTATINLTVLDQNAVPDTVIPAPPLGNCDPNNVCTTTVDVVFPFGASRGLTRVTWTQ
jgi:vancomycin resistance protein YoaR